MNGRSTGDRLARALEAALSRHLGDVREIIHNWVDWHSATFVGARHELRLTIGPGAAVKLDTISDDDLPLVRGFVADIIVMARAPCPGGLAIDLEVLTIAD